MAKIRIGFSTHFEVENELVGIGTDNPTNTKQVLGNIHATNAKAVGITTLTTPFEGFTDAKLSLQGSAGAKQHTTSGEIIIEGDVTVSSGTTFTSGPENLTVTDNFTLPGISDDKPSVGTTRFNENLGALEFYTGVEWKAVNSRIDMGNRGRGVFGGKSGGGSTQFLVDSIQIATKGNSVDWGTMLRGRYVGQNCIGGETRVIFCGGYGLSPSPETSDLTAIDYGTFASGGKCADFGDITDSRRGGGSCGSSTRGIYWGGTSGSGQILDYLEIATAGNAKEFQDLGGTARGGQQCTSSATRGVCAPNETDHITMNFITFSSTGSFTEFGDYINKSYMGGFVSNGTRGVTGGGYNPLASAYSQTEIGYINIASTGNAIYFGELTAGRGTTGVANSTRGVFGTQNPSVNTIDYINFSTTGNAEDFGDLVYSHSSSGIAGSDSHGGLGGF